jgi:hypothetical protein
MNISKSYKKDKVLTSFSKIKREEKMKKHNPSKKNLTKEVRKFGKRQCAPTGISVISHFDILISQC